MSGRRKSLGAIFVVPAILFAASLAGLIAALLVEEAGEAVFALLAGSGLGAAVWAFCARR